MKAVILPRGRALPPFLDPPGQVQVLGRDLAILQREELASAGVEVVDAPPAGEPWLAISDRTWFTAGTIRRFLERAQAPARLRVDHPGWRELTAALQELDGPGLYEIALVQGQFPGFDALPPQDVDLEFEDKPPPADHPAMAHALPKSLPVSDAGVHQIDHWTHILRVNWLAMSATIAREQRAFARANILVKAWKLLLFMLKARSIQRHRIARALSVIPRSCSVHPSAVVEASVLGENVEIGPFAVVRGSVLKDHARVEEHGVVNMSVLGEGARVGRKGVCNLVVLYPGAFVAKGNGYQACIFGRDSFAAWSVTIFDLAFHAHVKVLKDGERVDSGTYFMGAAVGHRVRLGGKVTLGYGSEVPNDAFLVGPSDDVMREWEPGEGPHRVEKGVAKPVRRR